MADKTDQSKKALEEILDSIDATFYRLVDGFQGRIKDVCDVLSFRAVWKIDSVLRDLEEEVESISREDLDRLNKKIKELESKWKSVQNKD